MRNTFINRIVKECEKRDDIFIIAGDAGYGVFDEFQKKYPDRFLNLGVAEQNMMSFAGGLSLSGFKVIVYNIIPFLLYRCYEQVRNDICYQELPVVFVGIGSGVTYSPQGMTHYSVEDIGLCQTLPNLEVFSPIDPVEAKLCAEYSLTSKNPIYVRLAKRGEPIIHKKEEFEINKPQILYDGEDVALVFHGSISEEVIEAVNILHLKGIYPKVISCCKIQLFDFKEFYNIIGDIKKIIVIEEHYENCGFGSILKKDLKEFEVIIKGIKYRFIHEIFNNKGMRKYFGIDAASIVKEVMR